MAIVPVPAWDSSGLLPPIDPHDPVSLARSPYEVTLIDFITRFATSPERVLILQGYLDHRAALHRSGLTQGFQWVDGSFVEDIEALESRPPGDVDVVTYADSTGAVVDVADEPAFLDAKATFHVDFYLVEIQALPPGELIAWSSYWYGLWSHRRSSAWKGFLQIDLNDGNDADARQILNQLAAGPAP